MGAAPLFQWFYDSADRSGLGQVAEAWLAARADGQLSSRRPGVLSAGRARKDKKTAEALKPWFRFLCKRPLSNNDYYAAFNQPNVELIDVSSTQGVEAMTEKGFVADGREYEVDCVIFASGFGVTRIFSAAGASQWSRVVGSSRFMITGAMARELFTESSPITSPICSIRGTYRARRTRQRPNSSAVNASTLPLSCVRR